ncbi:MAG: PepSY domain-containing protein [Sphingomonadales bacterium]|nr:PepSY domain-containing protein [Sphingomonadales bacterium]MDE2170917.1 PepSY domain-containing protein [Sphingomonadales bacterium]
MPVMARKVWVVVHRWAGLSIALFVAIAGLTGTALAWEDSIEAAIAPQLLRAPPCDAPRDAASLAQVVLGHHPGMRITYLPLTLTPGRSLRVRVGWSDAGQAPDWDELFIDPCTGRELGHRRWGDITQGVSNLMPFVYRLHYSLALGSYGTLLMGLAALVWTFDCFVGFYLTFPLRAVRPAPQPSGWLSRWKPAWTIRWGASSHKLTFDLHRAGGLWVWPILLVFALSSVAFNLPTVYGPAARALGARDDAALLAGRVSETPRGAPKLGLEAAERRGQELARQEAQRAHVALAPGLRWLWPVPGSRAYVYGFTTRGTIAEEGGSSRLAFDSDTGQLIGTQLADTAPPASRFTDWIEALHMARVFGPAWQLAVSAMGLAVTMLSITGVLLWAKKRRARRARR